MKLTRFRRFRRRVPQPPRPLVDQVIDAANVMIRNDHELAAEISSVIELSKREMSTAVHGVFEDLLITCEWFHEEGHESATEDEFARQDAADIRAHIALIKEAMA